MTLLQRIVAEKRTLLILLALGIVLNVAAYALIVYPLAVKSAGSVERAQAAVRSRKAAEQDLSAARALVVGKTRAREELATFFDKVLPADQPAAVRITYSPLSEIAKKANTRVIERRWEPDESLAKNSHVGRLRVHMSLQGDYASVRRFIYEIERAPEFVIIDNLTLAQTDPTKPLVLTMDLSSYYRLDH
jgi:flagellar basal body-associated protein FliL